MKIEIKHRWSGRVIFETDAESLGQAILIALKASANLFGADLCGADLCGADLCCAKGAEKIIAQTRILPDGDIIGWKKCRDGVLVKLLIPATAKRSHAFGRKCRAELAKVVEVIGAEAAVSQYDMDFIYKVGEEVKPKEPFSDDWRNECASGIHFFITRIEAENY